MHEIHLTSVLESRPEIIEPGLIFFSRQHYIRGKRVDLIFHDAKGQLLIVNVKINKLQLADVGQICESRYYLREELGVAPRGLLVGTSVSEEIAGAADVAGCETLAISNATLDELRTGAARGIPHVDRRAPTPVRRATATSGIALAIVRSVLVTRRAECNLAMLTQGGTR